MFRIVAGMIFYLRKSGHFILEIDFCLRCDFFSAANPSRPAAPEPSARGRQPDPRRPPPPKCGDASGGHERAAPVRAHANARGFTGAAVVQCRGSGARPRSAPLKRRHNTGMIEIHITPTGWSSLVAAFRRDVFCTQLRVPPSPTTPRGNSARAMADTLTAD